MAETLEVKKRETRGKRNARRDRAAGTTPAILYGHGAESVSLSVDSVALAASVQQGSPLVELAGDLKVSALIRDRFHRWCTPSTGNSLGTPGSKPPTTDTSQCESQK